MKMRQLASRPFIWLAVGALSVLIPTGPGCQAQTAGDVEIAKEGRAASSDPGIGGSNPDTPVPAPTPTPQAGSTISNLSKRVSTRERGAPEREDAIAINLGNKHFNALTGGIAHGAGMTFGLEMTTADLIKWVEFRVSAVTSTRFYRRFEVGA
jgi:hypothetical protein